MADSSKASKRRDIYEIEDSDEERAIVPKPTKLSMFGSLQPTSPYANTPTLTGFLKLSSLPTSYSMKPRLLTAFACFPKLPIELRAKIWDEAMPGPRVVEIYFSNFEYKGNKVKLFATPNPVPALLHVSQESRQIAQKRYTLHFGNYLDSIRQSKHTIYFDPKQDIAYMRSQKSFDPTYADHIPLIRLSCKTNDLGPKPCTSRFFTRIALSVGFAASKYKRENTVKYLLDFPKLLEVILIGDDEATDPDEEDDEEGELFVRDLQRYEKRLELVDGGEFIDEDWKLSASRLVAEIQRVYKTNCYKKVLQPKVTVMNLHRTTKVLVER